MLVKKKCGSWRLCADFTSLNKVIKTQKYALPNINDFSALAQGCKWFSVLDVADAYYNIPVNPQDQDQDQFIVNFKGIDQNITITKEK